MPASLETRNRLRVIRRLSKGFPDQTAEDRLERIAKIATGEIPAVIPQEPMGATMAQRIATGQASRSPRARDRMKAANQKAKDEKAKRAADNAEDATHDPEKVHKSEASKERERKGGKDRKEKGGSSREIDNIQRTGAAND